MSFPSTHSMCCLPITQSCERLTAVEVKFTRGTPQQDADACFWPRFVNSTLPRVRELHRLGGHIGINGAGHTVQTRRVRDCCSGVAGVEFTKVAFVGRRSYSDVSDAAERERGRKARHSSRLLQGRLSRAYNRNFARFLRNRIVPKQGSGRAGGGQPHHQPPALPRTSGTCACRNEASFPSQKSKLLSNPLGDISLWRTGSEMENANFL